MPLVNYLPANGKVPFGDIKLTTIIIWIITTLLRVFYTYISMAHLAGKCFMERHPCQVYVPYVQLCSKSANPPTSHAFKRNQSKSVTASHSRSAQNARIVPPFSIQAQQKNTIVINGPMTQQQTPTAATSSVRAKVHPKKKTVFELDIRAGSHGFVDTSLNSPRRPRSSFRMYFDRGDLPVKMEYLYGGDKIGWTVDIEKLDYSLYLPLFFDGLCETQHPYTTYARQGVSDLLNAGGDKIAPVIPQIILPLKNALSTRNLEVMCTTLKIIQQLVQSSDMVGPALVPFYRQLLPMFNTYKVKNLNCGDEIDFAQKKNLNLGDLIDETLQMLELHGGEDAFINIKYMVPTYESCYLN